MRAARLGVSLLAVASAMALAPSLAAANPPLAFTACSPGSELECAKLTVPADRSHGVKSIELNVERRKSVLGGAPTTKAVLALAGGPGQAALALTASFHQLIEPGLHGRDLLVIDQRGTGTSAPLHCAAAEGRGTGSEIEQYEHCAQESSEQGSFTTAESVQDIEALRQATGYSKLVLYGTSYGTKVALNYAETFPGNVESLVLDSVVPAEGEDAFHVHSFSALRGELAELCRGTCRFTRNDVADVAAFNARWNAHALSGRYVDGNGHRRSIAMNETDLWSLFAAGDVNPVIRAMLPGAVHAAVHGDSAPILHLWALANGLTAAGGGRGGGSDVNTVLFLTTLCGETAFPWNPAASYTQRVEEASAKLFFSIPSSSFYPFTAAAALYSGIVPYCAAWPGAGSSVTPLQPLPNVPTLILSGGQDLRTPTADARAVAARIPDAQLLVVPYVGHSVLGSDLSGCASRAVEQFFAGYPVTRCRSTRRVVPQTPAPRSPSALAGRTRAAKTLKAAITTLSALRYDVAAAGINGELGLGVRLGGERGGHAVYGAIYSLYNYSAVGGLTLSGSLRSGHGGTLHVGGHLAVHGTLHVTKTRIYGVLHGRRVSAGLPGARAFLTALGSDAGLPTHLPGPVIP